MTETSNEGAPTRVAPPPRAEAKAPAAKVYLDRSRDFSTIHGEITKGDPHFGVASYQNGLPFNHQDELIIDSPEIAADPKLQARADKLMARAQKAAEQAKLRKPVRDQDLDEDDEDADGEEDGEAGPGPVNLGAWARGQGDWPWQEISNFIARKYSKRVADKRAAIELCLEQHVVTQNQLSRSFRRLIES